MSLLQTIKNRVFNRSLQQLGKQMRVERKFSGFEKAAHFGILFDATDLNQRDFVLQYAHQLEKKGKKVKLLGFFDSKLDDPNFTFKYFNRKNLDWAGRPNGQAIQEFTEQAFDLMINLDTNSKPHAEFISAQSHAQLRVGPFTEHNFCYELMMDASDARNLKNFVQQMEFILEKTNTRQHETTAI